MEVVMPTRGMNFDFGSPRSLSSLTAPSSPGSFVDCIFSEPTSPRRIADFYRDFENFSMIDEARNTNGNHRSAAVPFDWEEKPGKPKSPRTTTNDETFDFAFDIGEMSETESVFAEELFDRGRIKPLKTPPGLQVDEKFEIKKSPTSSPRSPKSPVSQGKKFIQNAFLLKKKAVGVDPFETAIETTRKPEDQERGRERGHGLSTASNRRATRSLSPLRVSAYPWEEGEKQIQENVKQASVNSKASFSSVTSSSSSAKSSSKKWRLRDFLLFRSASEGRAANKDSIKNYTNWFRKHEEVKIESFRSTDGSDSSSSLRRRSSMSAHELHYMANKAASQELKKKTFLPYKRGILGRFAF